MTHTARAIAVVVLLAASVVGAAATPAAAHEGAHDAGGEAYAGTYVTFDATERTVGNYAVDGTVVIENVTAQAADAEGGARVGVELETSAAIAGSRVETRSQSHTRASMRFASGTTMRVHDNRRGVVQFRATDGAQLVQANVTAGATARSAGPDRVVVSREDGSQGVFIVVGEGNVSTDGDTRVTARLADGARLVYRQYNDGRSDAARAQERMIANGTATAEVYVQSAAAAGAEGQDAATSIVTYGQDTTVEVTSRTGERVELTVERTTSRGTVLLCTISNESMAAVGSLEVSVDGEAAARAESYSAVALAVTQGDRPRFLVRGASSVEAATNVAIGIDHFSTRRVTMHSAGAATPTPTASSTATPEGETATSTPVGGTDGDGTNGDGAGFGAALALLSLVGGLLTARLR